MVVFAGNSKTNIVRHVKVVVPYITLQYSAESGTCWDTHYDIDHSISDNVFSSEIF